jgi:membrane-associated protease RseP (regulator of RpoE activity)
MHWLGVVFQFVAGLPQPVQVVVLVFLGAWVALLVHELAHAVAARALGLEVWSMRLGWRPTIWRASLGGCRVQVGLLPLHGEIRLHDRDAEALGYRAYHTPQWRFEWIRGSWRAPAITMAGSVANLLVAAGILGYWVWMPRLSPYPFAITSAVFVVNLLMYLNLVPIPGLDGGRLVVQAAAWRRHREGAASRAKESPRRRWR